MIKKTSTICICLAALLLIALPGIFPNLAGATILGVTGTNFDLTAKADAISTGDMNAPEIEPKGRDEIASLGASFNRMRRSLENAMKLLEG